MKKILLRSVMLAVVVAGILVGCSGRSDEKIKDKETNIDETVKSGWYVEKVEGFKNVTAYDIMMVYAEHDSNLNYPISAQVASECLEISYDDNNNIHQVITLDTDKHINKENKFEAYNTYYAGDKEYNTRYHIKTFDNSREGLEGLLDYYLNEEILDGVIRACLNIYGGDGKKVQLFYLDGKIEIEYNAGLNIDIYKNIDILNDDGIDCEKLKNFEPLIDINTIKEMESFSIKSPFDKSNILNLTDISNISKNLEDSEKNSHRLKIEKVWTILDSDESSDVALRKYNSEGYGNLSVESVNITQKINDTTIELVLNGCDRFNRKRLCAVLIKLDSRDDNHLAEISSGVLGVNKENIEELLDTYMKTNGSEFKVEINEKESLSVYSADSVTNNIGVSYSYIEDTH